MDPLPRTEGDEVNRSSSEEDLEQSRQRRDSVHYATIGEFLASLKGVQDTAQGVKSLGLDDYLRAIRSAEQQPSGDGDPVEAPARESREQAKD